MQYSSKKNICLVVLVFVGSVLYLYPFFHSGIVNGDELLARYWNLQGFKSSFLYYFDECVYKGRTLSAWLIPITVFLGYLGKSIYVCKILQVVAVFGNVLLFGWLINNLFCSRKFAIFTSLLCIMFMSISFEPTLPGAYATTYGIIYGLFMYSLIKYVDYLEKARKGDLFLSMLLFFITICGYESFITYIPVYIFLAYFIKNRGKLFSIKNGLIQSIYPIITGIIFLILYIIVGNIFPSHYEGTQIGFSLKNALNIIGHLLEYSFPMVVLNSNKYKYLADEYSHYFTSIHFVCLICVLTVVLVLLVSVMKKEKDCLFGWLSVVILTFSCIITIILPTLPLSISSMYQGNVGERGFMGLPVTYFGFYPATLLLSSLIWKINSMFNRKIMQIIILISVIAISARVQFCNHIFSTQLNKNYTRIQTIESIFETNSSSVLEGFICCSTDLFKPMNTLGFYDFYWTSYLSSQNHNIQISNSNFNDTDGAKFSLFEQNDDLFVLIDQLENKVILFSKEKINKPLAIKISDEKYEYIEDVGSGYVDGLWNVYIIVHN